VIPTVSSSQTQILRWIIDLYVPGGFDADVTYSRGLFYRDGIPAPRLRFDIAPQVEGVVEADCRALPLERRSLGSLIVDLPFIHHPGKESRIGQRFSGFRSQAELRECYADTLLEMWRVLTPGGVLVWKMQDCVESGRQNWTHCHVWMWAMRSGWIVEDLFVQVSGRVMIGHNHARQFHARKMHSFWWVLRKPAERRSFTTRERTA